MIKQKNRQGYRKRRDKLAEIVRHEDRDMRKELNQYSSDRVDVYIHLNVAVYPPKLEGDYGS